MTESGQALTVVLTGQIPFVIIVAVLAAFPISFVLLQIYRRSVLRAMAQRSGVAQAPVERGVVETATRVLPKLEISLVQRCEPVSPLDPAAVLLTKLLQLPWRASLIYALGGAAFTLVMIVAFFGATKFELLPIRLATVYLIYAWPIVLAVSMVAGATWRDKAKVVGAYVLVLLLISGLALTRNTTLTPGDLLKLWAITNVAPTVLVFAFLARPIRAVGPMVLGFLVTAFAGSVAVLSLVGGNEAMLRLFAVIGVQIGLNAGGTFTAITLLGFLLFGIFGWLGLSWIRNGYRQKKITDQSISIDAMWLLFGAFQAIPLAFEGTSWILSGLVAFAAYKFVLRIGFRYAYMDGGGQANNARLLLLRVFSLGKRSERLFDAVTMHWRYGGSVQLIAGPDLVKSTIEPHEFIEFLSGKIGRLFVDSQEMLSSKIMGMDGRSDFDGRFRVNEFFCRDNTWQMVLSHLAKSSDAVLMDLRGFSRANAGCIHEIKELVALVPLDRVVLVFDNTTNEPFLREAIAQAWADVPNDSPNVCAEQPKLCLFQFGSSRVSALADLLGCLARAARTKRA